jgi:hypothetical protein
MNPKVFLEHVGCQWDKIFLKVNMVKFKGYHKFLRKHLRLSMLPHRWQSHNIEFNLLGNHWGNKLLHHHPLSYSLKVNLVKFKRHHRIPRKHIRISMLPPHR